MITRWRVCDIFILISYRWLEPCAVKVACTVPPGGKFAKTYLSEFELVNLISYLLDIQCGFVLCFVPSLTLAKDDKNISTKEHSSIRTGYIRKGGKLTQISSKELDILIENHKQKAQEYHLGTGFTSEFLSSLRRLSNGIFQAEGS